MPDKFARFTEALADLSISFLPILVLFALLIIFKHIESPRPDASFLVAALFTEAAWRCRKLDTERPTEKFSGILLGVFGAVISIVAAILLLLVEIKVLQPQQVLGVTASASMITFWAFLVAIPYALWVRYKSL